MLRRHTAVLVSVAAPLPDILPQLVSSLFIT